MSKAEITCSCSFADIPRKTATAVRDLSESTCITCRTVRRQMPVAHFQAAEGDQYFEHYACVCWPCRQTRRPTLNNWYNVPTLRNALETNTDLMRDRQQSPRI